MRPPRPALLLLLVPALAPLAGCAHGGDFPSLMPRPAERETSFEEPVRTPVTVASDPALLHQVATLESEGRAGAAEFEAAYGPATAAAGRAGAAGSDAWVVAQEGLSRVEAARDRLTTALAALDQLALQRADTATSEADFAALNAAAERLRAQAAAEQARINRLKAQLGG
jgi:hypothetical protein